MPHFVIEGCRSEFPTSNFWVCCLDITTAMVSTWAHNYLALELTFQSSAGAGYAEISIVSGFLRLLRLDLVLMLFHGKILGVTQSD